MTPFSFVAQAGMNIAQENPRSTKNVVSVVLPIPVPNPERVHSLTRRSRILNALRREEGFANVINNLR